MKLAVGLLTPSTSLSTHPMLRMLEEVGIMVCSDPGTTEITQEKIGDSRVDPVSANPFTALDMD
jgi:hypothetical protein